MNNHFEQTFDDILISTNKELLNIDVIHQYLSNESYWALCIPKTTVEKAIENSMCFGIYKNNIQIGFARVVTDKTSFGYLADVFIVFTQRGNGYSKYLMNTIHSHPELRGLRRWYLTTRDAHSLYKQYGWQHIDDEFKNKIMTIHNPNIYNENL